MAKAGEGGVVLAERITGESLGSSYREMINVVCHLAAHTIPHTSQGELMTKDPQCI